MTSSARPVLLYDGVCGFCYATVRVLLCVDRRQLFRFAPLGGDFAARMLSSHPSLQGIDSLVLVEVAEDGSDQGVYARSEALIRAAGHLGGAWRLLSLLGAIPRPLRDWAYDFFARHRYRVAGRFETCPVPTPEVRSRFLD
jgi:predicted DCC family thiol-disulfide oxidoreductase YuxK